ncbi:DinB family protein [bacterium]|nr:MAG: DinB family protein [bacterium]
MTLPQTPLELFASQLDWAHKNINNNLDFVHEGKLRWKPAPEAKSVLEIIDHAAGTVHNFTYILMEEPKTALAPATTIKEAKALITQVITAHLKTIQSLTPDAMEQTVTTPLGELPKGLIAALPVVELINHHGQITYIQSLLGDSESHLIVA